MEEAGLWHEAEIIVDKLWASSFTWTKGKPLAVYVNDCVTSLVRRQPLLRSKASVEEIVEETKLLLHIAVDEACLSIKPGADTEETAAQGLHPYVAIKRAMERAISGRQLAQPA